MIDRHLVGKEYPRFHVTLSNELLQDLRELVSPWLGEGEGLLPQASVWPAFLALHGSACFVHVWEEAGINPLDLRLVGEKLQLFEDPPVAQEIVGLVRVEDIRERMEPDHGIEDEICLSVTFWNAAGRKVASYQCAYRIPVAITSAR